jgi:hypothetical protein
MDGAPRPGSGDAHAQDYFIGSRPRFALRPACGDDGFLDPPVLIDDAGSSGSGGGSGAGVDGGAAGASSGPAGAGGSTAAAVGTGGGLAGTGGGLAGTGGSVAGSGGTGDAPDAGDPDASVVVPGPLDAGACTEPACECAVDAITALPYSQQWQTTEDTEADVVDIEDCQLCDNTADHIVTFTAPATATYRFFATSGGDVELAVYPGDCTALPNDVSCGEDLDESNEDYSDQVNVDIAQGETVTVVLGESCEENGGAGTLTIEVAPE